MSKVKITGNASGTGVFTIEAPGTNNPRTITLPDSTGTILDENSSLPAANLTGTVATARLGSGATSTTFLRGDQTYAAAGGKVQMVTGTFDGSLSSNLAITGAGFTPAGYIIHASNTSGVGDVSFGMRGTTTQGSVRHLELGTASSKWGIDASWIMYLAWSGGDVRCQHDSFDVDGITIRRIPLSSPAGDVRYNILFFG